MKKTHNPLPATDPLLAKIALEGADAPVPTMVNTQKAFEPLTPDMAARHSVVSGAVGWETHGYVPPEPQPDYRQWFIDQVAIGLIVRGRGQTDAWKVAERSWLDRQAHLEAKK